MASPPRPATWRRDGANPTALPTTAAERLAPRSRADATLCDRPALADPAPIAAARLHRCRRTASAGTSKSPTMHTLRVAGRASGRQLGAPIPARAWRDSPRSATADLRLTPDEAATYLIA